MRLTPVPSGESTQTVELRGFSLLEAMISISILAILVTGIFTITVESMSLLGDVEADYVVQIEADRAMGRLVAILNKTGRVKEKRVLYPRVSDGGAALEFRLTDDLDGDGYPFDRETAAIEWSPHVFSIKRDANANLSVYRSGTKIYTIAQHVHFLRFETVRENSALHLNEISIDLEIRKSQETERDVVFSLSNSAHMRN